MLMYPKCNQNHSCFYNRTTLYHVTVSRSEKKVIPPSPWFYASFSHFFIFVGFDLCALFPSPSTMMSSSFSFSPFFILWKNKNIQRQKEEKAKNYPHHFCLSPNYTQMPKMSIEKGCYILWCMYVLYRLHISEIVCLYDTLMLQHVLHSVH